MVGEFPSPQVGSELLFNSPTLQRSETFPSPQVGSERVGPHRYLQASFNVSIPSSRVGTGCKESCCEGCGAPCFHPLKSGRNHRRLCQGSHCLRQFPSPQVGSEPQLDAVTWGTENVSIPSSRVGTGPPRCPTLGAAMFPSPQVGSEREPFVVIRCNSASFHPLKSGRNFWIIPPSYAHFPVSIPSSRVGTSVYDKDHEKVLQVSIPSSRVGTHSDISILTLILVSIPSSRVGTTSTGEGSLAKSNVSIPSSRVGTGC